MTGGFGMSVDNMAFTFALSLNMFVSNFNIQNIIKN